MASPAGYGFSEMESETSSRDSDSSHESRENVRRRRKFVPMRDDAPDAEPLLQLRVRERELRTTNVLANMNCGITIISR